MTVTAEWKEFKGTFDRDVGKYCYPYLMPGDECRFNAPHSRRVVHKLQGRVGLFVKRNRVNWRFKVDGVDWNIHPANIVESRRGKGTAFLRTAAVERPNPSNVENSLASEANLSIGDIILCSRRGQRGMIFDVVRFDGMRQTRFGGICMESGKSYTYEDVNFVQKLDNSLFSGEKK